MAILGNIIKGVIGITDTLSAEPNHKENQEKVLKKLLETAQQTQFGVHYNFIRILKTDNLSKSFAEKVPYFDYHQMNEKWWHKLHKGETMLLGQTLLLILHLVLVLQEKKVKEFLLPMK